MPLASTTYQPDTVTTNVPMNAAGGGGGLGLDGGAFGQLLNQVAARRAAEKAQEREDRLEEQQYQRQQERLRIKMQQDRENKADLDRRNAREGAITKGRAIEQHNDPSAAPVYLDEVDPYWRFSTGPKGAGQRVVATQYRRDANGKIIG